MSVLQQPATNKGIAQQNRTKDLPIQIPAYVNN